MSDYPSATVRDGKGGVVPFPRFITQQVMDGATILRQNKTSGLTSFTKRK